MINTPKIQIAIFIPSYNRSSRLLEVVTNIYAMTPKELFNIYIIAEESDKETIAMVEKIGTNLIINEGNPCYADCINTAYRKTKEPYFFSGADDLNFHKNWAQEALSSLQYSTMCVIGTNDLGTIPIGKERDATHYVVKRAYIEQYSGVVDRENTVLYPYAHNYTDKEFVETARKRGFYTYNKKSIVEHMHPAWSKGQMDETYKKGQMSNDKDRRVFQQRQHLWA